MAWPIGGNPATHTDVRDVVEGLRKSVVVILYSGGSYPARPATSILPAGCALYKGPVEPSDWLANDEWVDNS
jgi:hypothetical protein